MNYPTSVNEILEEKTIPAVAANEEGILTFINEPFERSYGWTKEELIGHSITDIIPPHYRSAHHVGFSRFIATEHPTLLGKPLALVVLHKDGRSITAEHFILANKVDGRWCFGALIQIIEDH
jgi:PAS domain S-box-containing protein